MDKLKKFIEILGYEAEIEEPQSVTKKGLGLNVRKPGSSFALVIYESEKEKISWLSSLSAEELKETIEEALEKGAEDFRNLQQDLGWEKAKETIRIRISSEVPERIEHKDLLDLKESLYITVGSENNTGTISVTKGMLEGWGVTFEEAYEIAKDNMKKCLSIKSISEELSEMGVTIPASEEVPMQVVTTGTQFLGAGMLSVIPDVYEGEECFIIPSSIHELLLLPFWEDDAISIKKMISEVNSTLEPSEILSYNLYGYKKGEGIVIVA